MRVLTAAVVSMRAVTLAVVVALAGMSAGCSQTGSTTSAALPPREPAITLLPASTPAAGEVDQTILEDPRAEAEAEPATVSTDVAVVAEAASIECMTPRQRVAQLLLPLVTQPELAGARPLARSGDLGGIGLLGSPDQDLAAELFELQLQPEIPLFVASDEEGGTVQRLDGPLGRLPAAATIAESSPEAARELFADYARRAAELGVNVIFAPVIDVGGGPGIGSRAFGDDPATVAAYGAAVADGLSLGGIMPVFKHFPGHGRASTDTHVGLARTPPLANLRDFDLVPFERLVGDHQRDESGVMVGHLLVEGLGDRPASLSAEAIGGLLRDEIGFGGLVFTDAMNMGAIVNNYGALDALDLAFDAGADIAILGSLAELGPALDHLEERVATDLGFARAVDERLLRILEAKGVSVVCGGAR